MVQGPLPMPVPGGGGAPPGGGGGSTGGGPPKKGGTGKGTPPGGAAGGGATGGGASGGSAGAAGGGTSGGGFSPQAGAGTKTNIVVKHNYVFTLLRPTPTTWTCTAAPVRDRGDSKFFFLDQTGVMRSELGKAAGASSPQL